MPRTLLSPEERHARQLARQARWRASHREHNRAYTKRYLQEHPRDYAAEAITRREYFANYRATHREQYAAWRDANKEEQRQKRAQFRREHREARRQQRLRARQQHGDKIRAQERASRQRNLAQKRAYMLLYTMQHRSEALQRVKAWIATHPQRFRALQARRRARKREAPVNDFTAAQWQEMQEHYNHRCVYCGKRAKGHLTQDHITPLAKGGSHTKVNIVPACRSCNSRKHTGPVLTPVQPLLL